MKQLILDSAIVYTDRLNRELKEDAQLGPVYSGLAGPFTENSVQKIKFYFEDEFDSANETYLRFTFLPAFVDEDNAEDYVPKIIDFAVADAKKKDFQNIDYTKEVTHYWYRNDIWGNGNEKGLLLGVDYFSDEARTDLVLKVRIQYVQDVFGNLVSKQTERIWVNRNGTDNEDTKIRDNVKIYTPLQSRNATDRRRKNIIQQLEGDLITLLLAAAAGDPAQQGVNLNLGVQFLTAAADSINVFYRSGNPADIIAFVQDADTVTAFPFLLMEVAPSYTAQQFIIDGISY